MMEKGSEGSRRMSEDAGKGMVIGAGIGLVFGAAFGAPARGMVLGAALGLTGAFRGFRRLG